MTLHILNGYIHCYELIQLYSCSYFSFETQHKPGNFALGYPN